MAKRKYHKKKKKNLLKVNPQLQGFDIKINTFGEIQSNYEVDDLNEFLNKNLKDKKLKNKPTEQEDDDKQNNKRNKKGF